MTSLCLRSAAVVAAIALMLLAASPAPSAWAHARYQSSTPEKGEVLAASPSLVSIVFTQNIQKVSGTYRIEVGRDRGASVTAGPAVLDDTDRSKMSVPLNPNLTPGRYVVNWKNVSDDDGDPLEGAFAFYVQTQPTPIDLQNDQQLEQIGAPDTPAAVDTPQPTIAPATAGPTGAPTRGAVTPSGTPAGSGDGSSSNTGLYIVIGIAAAALLTGAGAFVWYQHSKG